MYVCQSGDGVGRSQIHYRKKDLKPCHKRALIEDLHKERPQVVSKAYKILHLSRSVFHYKSIKNDSTYIEALRSLSERHPREGFWKSYHRLRNRGLLVNHKKLYRIYETIGLKLRRKCKKRLPQREKHPLFVPEGFTQGWSIDFKSDVLSNGRKFRSFNVIDDYNREVLFIEVDYSLKSSRVVWVLQHLIARYGILSRTKKCADSFSKPAM